MRTNNGLTVWFTGLPCSGKTTIAKGVYEILKSNNRSVELLDGDNVREYFDNKDFTREGRDKHIKQIGYMANLLTRHGTIVLCSFVSPYKEIREYNKRNSPNYIEVYVKCPVEECIKRDVKGLYKKALAGEIKGFTGVDDPYEEPEHPDLIINTDKESLEDCVAKVMSKVHKVLTLKKTYSLFIGRWQPPHDGHKKLIDTVLNEGKNVAIALRNTNIQESDPYSINERIDLWKQIYPNAVVYPNQGRIVLVDIPDISEVIFGRKVGWDIREIHLDKETEAISATKIREEMKKDTKK